MNAVVQSSPAMDHVIRVVIFIPVIESISRVLYGFERLAGFDTTPIIRNAYLSRSVSEFWRRYNYRLHDWLYRNVFQATGGRRAPAVPCCWCLCSAACSTRRPLRWRPRD